MYKLDLPVDSRALQAVERRRAAESARHKRIFSTRERVLGVDARALERQVAERQQREEAEKQRDRAHDMLRVSIDRMALEQQREEEHRRRELAQELLSYRALHQRAEDSRDADINYKRQRAPEDNLSTAQSCGPASMQLFQGEGVGEDERKRAEMELNERTLRAQREERERQENKQKHQELLRGKELLQQDLRAIQLDALEEECRRAVCIALKSYNQAQADERQERERQEKLRREGEEMAEVWHMVTSDLLTECPEAAEREGEGSAVTRRVLPDRWKGMSPEQLSAIYRQREEQRAERENQRQLERQKEVAWSLQQLKQARKQVEEEGRMRELEKERRVQLDKYNQQLAQEQRIHQQYLNNQLYTNQPSARYFTQFGTSSR
ncbi:RIB43A-like with coiled-coils protein 1 [Pygocentrus nattereri]|uniref:RIB43A-like with coiled-coils protein 1 n=1 Tax=Pygocentrus nattereri TaxID=42514 RepID=A0A3B4D1G2_PYGNA|nr:RIB43A-like with coiled-coils protein 1 [Pygocentrus nattereri]